MAGLKAPLLVGGVVLLAVFGTVVVADPNSIVSFSLKKALEIVEHLPIVLRCIIFILLQTGAMMLFLPGTPFNLASGSMFGFVMGTVVAVAGNLLSSIFSFLISRYTSRNWAERHINKRRALLALDCAIADSGFYIVFLTRLAPIFPYGLCSYFFGVTKVEFLPYIVATTLGMLPGTVLTPYVGSLMYDLAGNVSIGIFNRSTEWMVVGAVVSIVAMAFITFVAKRALTAAMRKSSGDCIAMEAMEAVEALGVELAGEAEMQTIPNSPQTPAEELIVTIEPSPA